MNDVHSAELVLKFRHWELQYGFRVSELEPLHTYLLRHLPTYLDPRPTWGGLQSTLLRMLGNKVPLTRHQ